MFLQTLDDENVLPGQVLVVTRIIHVESNQWVESRFKMDARAAAPQDLCSAVTYARRYSLVTALGLTPEDDDGNKAQGLKPAQRAAAPVSKLPTAPPQVAVIDALIKENSISKEEAQRITELSTLRGITEPQAVRALKRLEWHIAELKGQQHA
jgi:hypothetical protein